MACGGRILVVDDDPEIRDALREALTALGCCVSEAQDGLAALDEAALEPAPCLVLLDLNMPRMCGEEFAALVCGAADHLPIVSMSAGHRRLEPPIVQQHLAKPFSVVELEQLVVAHCRGAGLRCGACIHIH